MNKSYLVWMVVGLSSIAATGLAQNVGVDVATPQEKLDIAGRLRLSSDISVGAPNGGAGTIRWNATAGQFQGWNGTTWVAFAAAETDPVFTASPAGGISATDITNWDDAFGWGDHALAGYLTAELDPSWDGVNNATGDLERSGNVGIGGAPSEKLHVIGNARATTGFIAGDGTVGTPAFRFAASPTTGIYRQGSDAIGIGTAGVERMRITSAGNVGIGLTADPTEMLEVGGNVKLARTANREISVAMEPSTSTAQPAKNLTVRAGNANLDNNSFAQRGGDLILQGGRGYTNTVANNHGGHVILRSGANELTSGSQKNGGDIVFETGGAANAVTERLRFTDTGVLTLPTINTSGATRLLSITSAGIVGTSAIDPANVGTVSSVGLTMPTGFSVGSSPVTTSGTIAVTSTLTDGLPVYATATGFTTTPSATGIHGYWTRTGTNLYNTTLGDNVGIGTNSPIAKLEVQEGGLNTAAARFVHTNATNSNGVVIQTQTNLAADVALNIQSSGGALQAFIVRNTGNVGVGTATPAAKLHVTSTGNEDGYIRLENTTLARYSKIAHDANGMLFKVSTDGDTYRWTNAAGTSVMTINPQTQNVGISTSTPAQKLEVVGNARISALVSGASGAIVRSNASGDLGFTNFSGTGTDVLTGAGTFVGITSLTTDDWTQSGSALYPNDLTWNVGIGTNSPSQRFQVGTTASTRYFTVGSTGLVTARFDDNNLIPVLTLENRSMTAVNHGVSINFGLNVGAGASVVSGHVRVSAEDTYAAAANQDSYMAFATALDGSLGERVRINAAGNVGIGNANPQHRLTVVNNGQSNAAISARDAGANALEWGHGNTAGYGSTIGHQSSNGHPFIAFNAEAGTNSNTYRTRGLAGTVLKSDISGGLEIGSIASVNADNQTPTPRVTIYGSTGNMSLHGGGILQLHTSTSNNLRGYMQAAESGVNGGAGLIIATSGGENISFKNGGVGGTEYMVISSQGRVGIGISPSYKLQLPNNSATDQGWVLAYSYNTYSDQRLKSDRKPLAYGLDAVMQLKPQSYVHHNSEVKDGKLVISETGTPTFGLMAQEAHAIIPEMVNRPADETTELWSVDYGKLGPVLVKAMQEQQELIRTMQQEIERLKAKVGE